MVVTVTKQQVDIAYDIWMRASKLVIEFSKQNASHDQMQRIEEESDKACQYYLELSNAYERQKQE